MKKVMLILGIVLCALGLLLEARFFISVSNKMKEQSQVSGFVRQLESDHGDSVSVMAVYHSRLIIRVSSDTTIKEMEEIVDEYEKWDSNTPKLTKIIFVDENATDTIMGYSSECMVVFAKSGSSNEFDIIDICNADPELYPLVADLTSYQDLSGRYRFNVIVPVSIDQTDDLSMIDSWYCPSDVECEGAEYLIQDGVNITNERNIEIA